MKDARPGAPQLKCYLEAYRPSATGVKRAVEGNKACLQHLSLKTNIEIIFLCVIVLVEPGIIVLRFFVGILILSFLLRTWR